MFLQQVDIRCRRKWQNSKSYQILLNPDKTFVKYFCMIYVTFGLAQSLYHDFFFPTIYFYKNLQRIVLITACHWLLYPVLQDIYFVEACIYFTEKYHPIRMQRKNSTNIGRRVLVLSWYRKNMINMRAEYRKRRR